jgi:DNA-binding NtrC family response regulator
MALEFRTRCESCGAALDPAGVAHVCAEECTFCGDCAGDLRHTCPKCGTELARRPRRGPPGADAASAAAQAVRYELARGLLGARDARQVAWRTVYSGLGALGVRSGAMWVLDERGRYRRLCSAGLAELPAGETLAIPAAAREWIAAQGVFPIAGAATARALGELRARFADHDGRIAAAVPGARGLGAVLVFGPPLIAGGGDDPENGMLETLAALAGQALETFPPGAGSPAAQAPDPAARRGRSGRDPQGIEILREKFPILADLIGDSPALLDACRDLAAVAPTRFPVLLSGESGVGKELAARAVHQMSGRADGPMEVIDCGSIPAELIESELFGHVRGAFTGAQRDRRGAFELAHRGTLFLDEVGEMPMQLQTRLLRVLQEGRIRRVGDERTIDVDVRVVAATHRDLAADVAAQRFRQDLYYRLNVFAVRLPPLRERREDIGRLLRHYLVMQGRELGVRQWRIDDDVVAALEQYDWPGNVRELVNLCAALAVQARATGVVRTSDLAHVWKRQHIGRAAPWNEGAAPVRDRLGEWVLDQARGARFNLVELARILQRQKRAGQRVPIAERSALSYYLTGEILRALAGARGDGAFAAQALGREDDLASRLRGRIGKVEEALRGADTLADARERFAKLPAGYESALEDAWSALRGN